MSAEHAAERARADYLAVVRHAHMYPTGEAWGQAEEQAWAALCEAEDAVRPMAWVQAEPS